MNSPENIGSETTLRQFQRARDDILDLAKDAGYRSERLDYLLSLLPQIHEESSPISFDDQEVKKIEIFMIQILF